MIGKVLALTALLTIFPATTVADDKVNIDCELLQEMEHEIISFRTFLISANQECINPESKIVKTGRCFIFYLTMNGVANNLQMISNDIKNKCIATADPTLLQDPTPPRLE